MSVTAFSKFTNIPWGSQNIYYKYNTQVHVHESNTRIMKKKQQKNNNNKKKKQKTEEDEVIE